MFTNGMTLSALLWKTPQNTVQSTLQMMARMVAMMGNANRARTTKQHMKINDSIAARPVRPRDTMNRMRAALSMS
jgi:hypothetical protein